MHLDVTLLEIISSFPKSLGTLSSQNVCSLRTQRPAPTKGQPRLCKLNFPEASRQKLTLLTCWNIQRLGKVLEISSFINSKLASLSAAENPASAKGKVTTFITKVSVHSLLFLFSSKVYLLHSSSILM